MTRALVVVEPEQQVLELLDVATDFARGSGSELLLFHVTDTFDSGAVRDKMRELTGVDHNYRAGIEGAESFATYLGEALLPEDVRFSVEGAFGNSADRIVAATEEFDCDHVFLTGRQRTPTGKAVFGDTTQDVILSVDVPVTLVMG
ncbi:universal stress protein [Haloarcula pellucida]|uniref:Universal stress protein UspA n=1 Tax=Haloarcula pellucida TaxID=1427151 RepID=A0A830GJK2_9EURY|nr:universal stress protein [Halomicroarcula pellucida]MBX0347391.1 universal stress protein [Halomicroarcula pellucida]GGN88428.1 universal stress protein UspA [Halomicroarcula pellucida]